MTTTTAEPTTAAARYFANVSGGDSAETSSRASMMQFLIDAIANYHGGMIHTHASTAAELLIRDAEEQGRTCSVNGAFAVVVAPLRDWTNVGAEFTGEANDGRRRVERQIEELTWVDVPQDGSGVSVAFIPGEAIKAAIAELRLPRVQRIATDGYLTWPDGPETAHYSIYGIECLYKDYLVRLYVLDSGTDLTPLAADRWPR